MAAVKEASMWERLRQPLSSKTHFGIFDIIDDIFEYELLLQLLFVTSILLLSSVLLVVVK
jgi:hypothetical protein